MLVAVHQACLPLAVEEYFGSFVTGAEASAHCVHRGIDSVQSDAEFGLKIVKDGGQVEGQESPGNGLERIESEAVRVPCGESEAVEEGT